jgi:hypothetical protein
LWLLAFIGFFLLHAGWALAAPYDGPPDEQQHALRAASIMHGHILTDSNNVQTVPKSLVRQFCFPMQAAVPASCAIPPGGDETLETRYVSEARFNPVYYAVTGWPLAFWPTWRGIMLSRFMTGAMMAALLACAVVAAARWTRSRALVAGIVVASTPMIAHLGGSINPNGVEIAAGMALFAALIAVLHEQQEGINRAAVALAGVSASVLVTPRFSGLMWLAVILGAMMIPMSKARLRELARSRSVRVWVGVIVLATLASVAWTILTKTAEVRAGDNGWTTNQILRTGLFDMWPNLVNQMIGVMGWAETLMPRLIYVVWFMAAGLLLLGSLAFGNRTDRWRMLALFFGVFTPLLAAELYLANRIGWFNQGRYFLPGAVGLPLLAAHIVARRSFTSEQMRTVTRLLAVLLVPIQLVCLLFTMARWQSGFISINPFNGSWVPPYGHVLPLVAGSLSVIVLLVMYWRASRIPVQPAASEVKDTDTNQHEPITEQGQSVSA